MPKKREIFYDPIKGLKECYTCGQIKSVDEFGTQWKGIGRKSPYCDECRRGYAKDRYNKLKGR